MATVDNRTNVVYQNGVRLVREAKRMIMNDTDNAIFLLHDAMDNFILSGVDCSEISTIEALLATLQRKDDFDEEDDVDIDKICNTLTRKNIEQVCKDCSSSDYEQIIHELIVRKSYLCKTMIKYYRQKYDLSLSICVLQIREAKSDNDNIINRYFKRVYGLDPCYKY